MTQRNDDLRALWAWTNRVTVTTLCRNNNDDSRDMSTHLFPIEDSQSSRTGSICIVYLKIYPSRTLDSWLATDLFSTRALLAVAKTYKNEALFTFDFSYRLGCNQNVMWLFNCTYWRMEFTAGSTCHYSESTVVIKCFIYILVLWRHWDKRKSALAFIVEHWIYFNNYALACWEEVLKY